MAIKLYRSSAVLAVLLLCATTGGPLWAQGRHMARGGQGMRQRDPLASLEPALQNAGAPALSTAQQQQLQSLIQTYQDSRKAAGLDPAVQSARQSLDNAVLSGNAADATTAADALAEALAKNLPKTLEAQANFEIQALAVLQPQVSALQQKLGNAGILRVLRSMTGGFGRAARFMPGMGGVVR